MDNNNLANKGASMLLIVFLLKITVSLLIWVAHTFLGTGMPSQTLMVIGTQLIAILLPALAFAYFLRSYTGLEIKAILKIKGLSVKQILLCVIIGCAVQAVSIVVNLPIPLLLSRLFGGLPPQLIQAPESMRLFLFGLITFALLPAICEELLFRGVILTTQEKAGGYAILVSAMYFALLHNDISTFLGIFTIGLVLGYVTFATGSVFSAMIIHIFSNAFAFVLQYMASNYLLFGGQDRFYYIMAIICLPILILSLRSFLPIKMEKGSMKQAFINFPFLIILLYYLITQLLSFLSIMRNESLLF